MAGFGFSSMKMDFPAGTSEMIQIVYLSVTAAAIGFELCAILNSAIISVFGPGKFLRGHQGLQSAKEAVQVMEDYSEPTMQYFTMGFFCIIASSSLKAFILHSFISAVIVTGGLILMGKYLLQVGLRIKDSLYVQKESALTGEIRKDQIQDPTDVRLQ